MAVLLVWLSCGATQAANSTLSLTATAGEVSASERGTWNTMQVTGQTGNPTIVNIINGLTLLGTANQAQMVSPANTTLRIDSAGSLNFGSATSGQGGFFSGQVELDGGSMTVNGTHGQTITYRLSGTNGATGSITSNAEGTLQVRNRGILQVQSLGSAAHPLANVKITGTGSRLQAGADSWIDHLEMNGGNLSMLQSDEADIHLNIGSLELNNYALVQVNRGDITIGDLVSSVEPSLQGNAIVSQEGNITVTGTIQLNEGLTMIRAEKDVTFVHGDQAVHGDGELYLRAGGNVNAGSGRFDNVIIEALRMNITGELTASNVLAAQLAAQSMRVGGNVSILGDTASILGHRVDWGSLTLSAPSSIGGSLEMTDAKLEADNLSLGADAKLDRVEGVFANLEAQGTVEF